MAEKAQAINIHGSVKSKAKNTLESSSSGFNQHSIASAQESSSNETFKNVFNSRSKNRRFSKNNTTKSVSSFSISSDSKGKLTKNSTVAFSTSNETKKKRTSLFNLFSIKYSSSHIESTPSSTDLNEMNNCDEAGIYCSVENLDAPNNNDENVSQVFEIIEHPPPPPQFADLTLKRGNQHANFKKSTSLILDESDKFANKDPNMRNESRKSKHDRKFFSASRSKTQQFINFFKRNTMHMFKSNSLNGEFGNETSPESVNGDEKLANLSEMPAMECCSNQMEKSINEISDSDSSISCLFKFDTDVPTPNMEKSCNEVTCTCDVKLNFAEINYLNEDFECEELFEENSVLNESHTSTDTQTEFSANKEVKLHICFEMVTFSNGKLSGGSRLR